ncbi:insulinase family protein [Candidatus Roizmanbacteria bacterium]|nr:insulinase family protein [Candidatus Roizmanbacteria bacterium]
MKTELFTLPNGLRVILIDTKAFPTLTTLLIVGAGSRYELEENNGVAHFLEHMFFKGSKKYPDPFTLTSTIESLGGIWNAFTSKDYTGYFIKATSEHFDIVIDVLSDVLLRPLFKEEEIEKEKGVIVEEINMYEDMPQSLVGDLYENLLYKGNPLGFDVIGTKKTVRSFNRQIFLDYRSQLYHPQNSVLVIAGGLNMTKTGETNAKNYLQVIAEKFGEWQNGQKSEFTPMNEIQDKPQIFVKTKNTEQAHFCLGYRTFASNDKRKRSLEVLAAILGVGASSKLFMELREKRGLCYYIGTGLQYYHDVGNMVTQAGVPKDVKKVTEAMKLTLEEHQKMLKDGFTKTDITKAKEILKGRLLLSMEDSFNVAHFYGKKAVLELKIESPQEVVDEIEKVTDEEIIAVANDIIKPSQLNITAIGPFEEKDFENLIK